LTSPRYLLDTNIVIYIRQRRPAAVWQRFEKLEVGEAGLSVITYGELLYGIGKLREQSTARMRLAELMSLLTILPLVPKAAETYGRLRADLAARGQLIGTNDLWIAAHALASGLVLVTNNVREFERIPALAIENWTRSLPR
jgi:tRNA(fMet)-specific endonuclease VapC